MMIIMLAIQNTALIGGKKHMERTTSTSLHYTWVFPNHLYQNKLLPYIVLTIT